MPKESTVQNEIRMAMSKIEGVTNWRNNTATGWAGKSARVTTSNMMTLNLFPGDVVVRSARPLHAGLCAGSSDIIGLKSVTITPDMIGQTVAVFTAIEVKTPRGKATDKQVNFLKHVANAGGIAMIARSVDDLEPLK